MDKPIINSTSTISRSIPGGNLRRVMINCPIHGRIEVFEATDPFGEVITGGCTKCQDERREVEVVKVRQSLEDPILKFKRMMLVAGIPEDYFEESFDTFTFKGFNDPHRDLVDQCRLFVMNKDRTLVMVGDTGVGKSHLGCSILREFLQQGRSAQYVTEGSLLRRIKATFSRRSGLTEDEVVRNFTVCDCLVIDEMGLAPWSEYSVQALADIIDTRVSRLRKTVFLGNMEVQVFKAHLSDASISRINMGRVFEVAGDDYRKLRRRRELV